MAKSIKAQAQELIEAARARNVELYQTFTVSGHSHHHVVTFLSAKRQFVNVLVYKDRIELYNVQGQRAETFASVKESVDLVVAFCQVF